MYKRQGKGKGDRTRTPSPNRDTIPGQNARGVSPSGERDRPACRRFLAGKCPDGDQCKFWHPGKCKFFKEGKCLAGNKCSYVHSKAAPARQPDKQKPDKADTQSDAGSEVSTLSRREKRKARAAAAKAKAQATAEPVKTVLIAFVPFVRGATSSALTSSERETKF